MDTSLNQNNNANMAGRHSRITSLKRHGNIVYRGRVRERWSDVGMVCRWVGEFAQTTARSSTYTHTAGTQVRSIISPRGREGRLPALRPRGAAAPPRFAFSQTYLYLNIHPEAATHPHPQEGVGASPTTVANPVSRKPIEQCQRPVGA